MGLPKFLRKYGRNGNTKESSYVPDMNTIALESIPVIIGEGAKGTKTKILITRTPEQARNEYRGLLEKHKEGILYAMKMGFLEMYALKSDVDPDSVPEFALVDRKHLLLTKHPNLKPDEVVSLTRDKRMGEKYMEHHQKMIEGHSIRLTANDLF